jgi:hypothetical protein
MYLTIFLLLLIISIVSVFIFTPTFNNAKSNTNTNTNLVKDTSCPAPQFITGSNCDKCVYPHFNLIIYAPDKTVTVELTCSSVDASKEAIYLSSADNLFYLGIVSEIDGSLGIINLIGPDVTNVYWPNQVKKSFTLTNDGQYKATNENIFLYGKQY